MKPQRLDLCYRIVWKGNWHVGSGYQSAVADRLVRRMPNGKLFVPGSQIKGVLRHQCERLASILQAEVINPHAGNRENDRHLVENFKPLTQSDLLIDRLFGTRYQGECLFVTNATPAASSVSPDTLPTRTRTAIDRVTGTVKERNLFTTQVVASEVCLQGTIRARHAAGILTQDDDEIFPYEYALLVTALLSLDALGGDKSVGLGRCAIEASSLRWNGRSIDRQKALQSFEEEGEEWYAMVEMVREEMAS